ncbi:MAG: arsenate reductase [Rhodobacteraceae bacterium]|jgi:arsenate reductase|nr:arsenate reductase [Paracoccaceae bacterium]
MLIYGLKNCDKCRAARKVLLNSVFVDLRENPFPKMEICTLVENYGDDIVNKKSTTWRSLTEADRQLTTTDLLEAHPTLFKRPIIKDSEGHYTFGWTKGIIEQYQPEKK